MKRLTSHGITALTLLAGTTLAGCESAPYVRIRDDAPAVVAETAWNPKLLHFRDATYGGFLLGYERYRGTDAQFIEAPNTIRYDKNTVAGGQIVDLKVTAELARLQYRHRFKIKRWVEMDAAVGIGYSNFEFDASGTAIPGHTAIDEQRMAASGSFTLRGNITKRFGVEARWAIDGALRSAGVQAAGVFRPVPSTMIRLGAYSRLIPTQTTDFGIVPTHVRTDGEASLSGVIGSVLFEF
jgi:hypothetical protein